MPRKGRGQLYEDADLDYYEEDDYGDEDEFAAAPSKIAPIQRRPPAPRVWSCSICTYENHEELPACEMCGVIRNGPESSSAARDGNQAEPSRLASSLFAPLPPPKLKKGKALEQAIGSFASRPATVGILSSSAPIEPFDFSTPSPDDRILGAQKNKAASVQPTRSSTQQAKAPEKQKLSPQTLKPPRENGEAAKSGPPDPRLQVEEQLEQIELADPPARAGQPAAKADKYRSLPLDTYKPEAWMTSGVKGNSKGLVHLVVVGHVDAGKSTLMGHVLHIVGRVSQKTMHKNQKDASQMGKASFAYAWALDEGSEERARGVTIKVAVAHFETPKLQFVLLDAPGHRDFVPNMISGAAQADAALLVVDASVGGFEAGMKSEGQEVGQTREHAQLVRSLGVNQLVVAVNKMDTVDFSKDRFDEIRGVLAPFLRQCGFRDNTVSWIPVSAFEGQNLSKSPTNKLFNSWYKGPTLIDALDKFEPPPREISKPFRLAIAELVKTRGMGAAGVGGKIEAGAVKIGSKVMVMPGREVATVKNIEQDGQARQVARAGESVDMALQGIDTGLLIPGGVLCHPDYLTPIANRLELRIVTLKLSIPILCGSQVVIYVHHAKEPAIVAELTSLLDLKTGEPLKRSPRCLMSNQSAIVQLSLERGICVEEYSKFRALGRVVLRSGTNTVAVGIVTRIVSCV